MSMAFYRSIRSRIVHAEDCPLLKRKNGQFVKLTWPERQGLTDKAKMEEYLNNSPHLRPCRVCLSI